MELDTLQQYKLESENEKDGWRGVLGKILTFSGFIVLANAFLIGLLFRHLMSFSTEMIIAATGAAVGAVGMIIRGNKRSHVLTAVFLSLGAILTRVIVSFALERFGWIVLIVGVVLFVWLVQRLEQRAWEKL
jgi:hypothetical protein